MPKNNIRKCDDCGVGLDGECYVDGSLLLCTPCAENPDRDARGGHDCHHEGMDGLPTCLVCRERLTTKED